MHSLYGGQRQWQVRREFILECGNRGSDLFWRLTRGGHAQTESVWGFHTTCRIYEGLIYIQFSLCDHRYSASQKRFILESLI